MPNLNFSLSKKTVFTGLIQGQGSIQVFTSDRLLLSVAEQTANSIMSDLAIGDSVAVDGVCLTVEEILPQGFIVTASPETLQRTTLDQRNQAAASVNLETSLRMGSKLGGHFVTGHVDGIGCLLESIPSEKAWEMTFAAPTTLQEQWKHYIGRYIVSKGSIAVNGISLTIADCDAQGSWFKVAIIPLTYAQTNLCHLKIGDLVNLEADILGKYVDKLINHRLGASSSQEEISLGFLSEHGYVL